MVLAECPCSSLSSSPSGAVKLLCLLLRGSVTNGSVDAEAYDGLSAADLAKLLLLMSALHKTNTQNGTTRGEAPFPLWLCSSPILEAMLLCTWAASSVEGAPAASTLPGSPPVWCSLPALEWLFGCGDPSTDDDDERSLVGVGVRHCVRALCSLAGHDDPSWSAAFRYFADAECGAGHTLFAKRRRRYFADVPLVSLQQTVPCDARISSCGLFHGGSALADASGDAAALLARELTRTRIALPSKMAHHSAREGAQLDDGWVISSAALTALVSRATPAVIRRIETCSKRAKESGVAVAGATYGALQDALVRRIATARGPRTDDASRQPLRIAASDIASFVQVASCGRCPSLWGDPSEIVRRLGTRCASVDECNIESSAFLAAAVDTDCIEAARRVAEPTILCVRDVVTQHLDLGGTVRVTPMPVVYRTFDSIRLPLPEWIEIMTRFEVVTAWRRLTLASGVTSPPLSPAPACTSSAGIELRFAPDWGTCPPLSLPDTPAPLPGASESSSRKTISFTSSFTARYRYAAALARHRLTKILPHVQDDVSAASLRETVASRCLIPSVVDAALLASSVYSAARYSTQHHDGMDGRRPPVHATTTLLHEEIAHLSQAVKCVVAVSSQSRWDRSLTLPRTAQHFDAAAEVAGGRWVLPPLSSDRRRPLIDISALISLIDLQQKPNVSQFLSPLSDAEVAVTSAALVADATEEERQRQDLKEKLCSLQADLSLRQAELERLTAHRRETEESEKALAVQISSTKAALQEAMASAERDVAEQRGRLQARLNNMAQKLSAQLASQLEATRAQEAAIRAASKRCRIGDPAVVARAEREAAVHRLKEHRRAFVAQTEIEHSLIGKWPSPAASRARTDRPRSASPRST